MTLGDPVPWKHRLNIAIIFTSVGLLLYGVMVPSFTFEFTGMAGFLLKY